MSSECLNSSLTPLDWVNEVRPPGTVTDVSDKLSPLSAAIKAPRKPPPVPVDLNANLDPVEARQYKFMDEKPPYSYATLIIYAINSSYQKKLTLSQIYDWIISNFAYYKDTHTGWKNSIRHNLSLNKCFKKVSRPKGETGKGAYWEIDLGAIPRRMQDGDPPLTPDSTTSDPKISPGPSPTLNELYQSNSSFSSGEYSPVHWDIPNNAPTSGHHRTTATFYSPSHSGGHFLSPQQHPGAVQDSGCFQPPPQVGFLEYSGPLMDPAESFTNFYSVLNSSLSLSDHWKLPSPEMPLGASAAGSQGGKPINIRHLPPEVTSVIQIAEDIHVNQSFEPHKIEKLSQAFNQVQPAQLGLLDKDFDIFANSFRKFINSWHRSPQASMQDGKLSCRHHKQQQLHTGTYTTSLPNIAPQHHYPPPPPPTTSAAATHLTSYTTSCSSNGSSNSPSSHNTSHASPIISDVSIFSEVTRHNSRPVPLNEIHPTLPPVSEELHFSSGDDAFQRAFENALN